ncbi:hypothetical protein BDV10DRAFT_125573 [Aspergillus recurvatus]
MAHESWRERALQSRRDPGTFYRYIRGDADGYSLVDSKRGILWLVACLTFLRRNSGLDPLDDMPEIPRAQSAAQVISPISLAIFARQLQRS